MRWGTYFAVCLAVISIGLAMGVTMPLVSLRLESWGYGSFAIGIMAATPAIGVLLGASLAGGLAARCPTPRLMQFCLLAGALSVTGLALLQSYPVWIVLRLLLGVTLTVVFILGESWINQLAVEKWRGRLVALYGTGYALSQLCGPLLLSVLGTDTDLGFWFGVSLLVGGSLLLIGRTGAPVVDAHSASGRGLLVFCQRMPAIAWAVMLFAAFEAMMLTLLPIYGLRQGFTQEVALFMASVVVVGDAVLQLPIGLLADRISRVTLFRLCGVVLLLSSLGIPLLLHTPVIWPVLVLFGASAGGLFTLSLILIGERFRDDQLVRANAHVAQLWGIGCLVGPLATGAVSQWISGHALPMLMAVGAAAFIWLAWRPHAFDERVAL
ncbi:MFS transporter [Pseudomonas straminea]|uniref:Predicted arabinose efflux permease, MFS family n=1 Tax=Pseudomonas straminea TaxID=47882 RepID=A0A1I1WUG7_PSEOC|nr:MULTISPECIES: MFS transporter [Pseudomonas]TWE02997.1 putative MFS family arabinose efflux permease [Pseudomonas sp. AG1028]GLX14917.1 MFS transporter [Pseudomonas straminea]SFD98689.1 Predicted arabinose efflux permease, MFS family [Pseudomonas straminea]